MKKIISGLAILALTLFTGCSEKSVDLQNNEVKVNETSNKQELNKLGLETIYFGFDKYNLTADNKSKAVSNASKLSAVSSDTTVKVLGNTDEWGSDEYNYALGLKRANAVKDVLVANGVTTNISLVSLGESNPVCTEKTKDCWAQNRRVQFSE